jgi:hypothetical protein
MGKIVQLRCLARHCEQMGTETDDPELIALLERLGRTIAANLEKLERAATDKKGAIVGRPGAN